jgi:hypothetical protein
MREEKRNTGSGGVGRCTSMYGSAVQTRLFLFFSLYYIIPFKEITMCIYLCPLPSNTSYASQVKLSQRRGQW